ncbi:MULTISPECIES: hypothetical protein [unclassified Nocardioides]|uniref:hypothetical protein n=1 Tax=unclassified Nocardioides TaxID=2615069 RepID=UPI0036098480
MINPLAAANAQGRIAVSWQRKVRGAVVLMASVRRDGGWLTRRLDVQNQGGWSRNPAAVVVDRSDNVVVAWYRGSRGDAGSYVSRLDAGAADWEEPVQLGTVSEPFHDCICQPVLTEAPDGTTYVSDRIWGFPTPTGTADVSWARGEDDATWEVDEGMPVIDAMASSVVVGDHLVVGDPTDGGRLVHELLPDGSWTTTTLEVRPDHVALTGSGRAVAIELPDYHEEDGLVRVQARLANGGWGPARVVYGLGARVTNRTLTKYDGVARPYLWNHDVAAGPGDTVSVLLGTAPASETWRRPDSFDVRVLSAPVA